MNKYEFQQRIEEGEELIAHGHYMDAVQVFDVLNLELIKQPVRLQKIAKAYEKCRRYGDAEELLLQARKLAPRSRSTLFHLCAIALKAGEIDDAKKYYQDFAELAKFDAERFVLQYRIAKAEGKDDEELIHILENLRSEEPDDRWMYELAKLYANNYRSEDAIAVCNEIDTWFYSGKYTVMAKELRAELLGLKVPNELSSDEYPSDTEEEEPRKNAEEKLPVPDSWLTEGPEEGYEAAPKSAKEEAEEGAEEEPEEEPVDESAPETASVEWPEEPVEKSETAVEESETEVEKSETPVEDLEIPVEKSETPEVTIEFPEETPAEESETAVEKSDTPAEEIEEEPLEEEKPVPLKQDPEDEYVMIRVTKSHADDADTLIIPKLLRPEEKPVTAEDVRFFDEEPKAPEPAKETTETETISLDEEPVKEETFETPSRPSEEIGEDDFRDPLDDDMLEVQELIRHAKEEQELFRLPYNPEVTAGGVWHFLVYGESNALTLSCARERMKEIMDANPNAPQRMLRISSEKIEGANIVDSLDRFLGNMVIVEQAASLSDEQLRDFAKVLDRDDRSLIVAFTDSRRDLLRMFERVPELRNSFSAVYEGKEYSLHELVTVAKEYLYTKDARVNSEGEAALLTYARKILNEQNGFYRNDMRDYAAAALDVAEKKGFLGLGGGKVDKDGFLIVSGKHFRKAGIE